MSDNCLHGIKGGGEVVWGGEGERRRKKECSDQRKEGGRRHGKGMVKVVTREYGKGREGKGSDQGKAREDEGKETGVRHGE